MFPFCGGGVSSKSKEVENESNTPADFLLSCIAKATCHTYQDHIVRIPSLSINSTKQLYTDIGNLIFYFFLWVCFQISQQPLHGLGVTTIFLRQAQKTELGLNFPIGSEV